MAIGLAVALVNPLRTHPVAGRNWHGPRPIGITGLQIARFGAQKRPAAADLPEAAVSEELRELARLRERSNEEMVARINQLIGGGFRTSRAHPPSQRPHTGLATAIRQQYPPPKPFAVSRKRSRAEHGRHQVVPSLRN